MTSPTARLLRVALLFGLAAGCQRSTPPPTDTAGTPMPPPSAGDEAPPPDLDGDSDDALFACSADSDCEVVEMGCCDHCNGGWQLSVNKTQKDAAIAKHHDKDCDGTACTKRGCDWNETPVCKAGTCARTEDRDGDASTPPELIDNTIQ